MSFKSFLFLSWLLVFSSMCSSELHSSSKSVYLDYVVKEDVGSNLTTFSHRIARVTQTYKIIVARVGQRKANEILNEELQKNISENQERWNENMALAHAKHMSEEEILSLLNEGSESPNYPKRVALQGEIGKTMRELSEKLLNQVVTDSLASSLARVDGKI